MVCLLCTFWTTTYAFSSQIRHGKKPSSSSASCPSLNYQTRRPSRDFLQSTRLLSSVVKGPVDQVGGTVQFSSTDAFNDALASICKKDKTVVEDAMRLLQQCEEKAPHILNQASYTIVIQTLAVSEHAKATEWAEELLQRMKDRSHEYPQCLPTADAYNALIFVWSKSSATSFSFPPHQQPKYVLMTQQQSLHMAAKKCTEYLSHMWFLYNSTSKDRRYIPFKSSYISTITALSRSRGGRKASEKAEELLEEMERLHVDHPHLAPTTICCNIVL
jgi:hypothetical protein